MITLIALLSLGIFVCAFWRLHIVQTAVRALTIVRGAVAAMRNPSLDEDARERTVQSAAVTLLGTALSILIRSIVALLLSIVPVWLAERLDLAAQEDVLSYLVRWEVILAVSLAMLVGHLLRKRLPSCG